MIQQRLLTSLCKESSKLVSEPIEVSKRWLDNLKYRSNGAASCKYTFKRASCGALGVWTLKITSWKAQD